MHGADRQRHLIGGRLAPQAADHHIHEAAARDAAVGIFRAIGVESVATDFAVGRGDQARQEVAFPGCQAQYAARRVDQGPAFVRQPPRFLHGLIRVCIGRGVHAVQPHRAPHQRLQHRG
ncbi:hypothetical protein G6F22_020308 [Rhizopus arrhizus]|nr:hypothetical protein G6F22_020308 [Rhizopus arrhizus]